MKGLKKTFGRILLEQVMAAGRFVGFGSRQPKKDRKPRNEDGSRKKKPKFKAGEVGLSMVSEAIIKDHGRHVDRRTRKLISKRTGKPFKAYYNGSAAEYRRSRNFQRSKYNGKGELV